MLRFRVCISDWCTQSENCLGVYHRAQCSFSNFSISSVEEHRRPGGRGFDSHIEYHKVSSMEEQQTHNLCDTGSNPVLYSTPALGMGTSLGTSPKGTGAIPNRFESVFFLTPQCWLFRSSHHQVVEAATVKGQCDRNSCPS